MTHAATSATAQPIPGVLSTPTTTERAKYITWLQDEFGIKVVDFALMIYGDTEVFFVAERDGDHVSARVVLSQPGACIDRHEDMGPTPDQCPPEILALLTPTDSEDAIEWRQRARAWWPTLTDDAQERFRAEIAYLCQFHRDHQHRYEPTIHIWTEPGAKALAQAYIREHARPSQPGGERVLYAEIPQPPAQRNDTWLVNSLLTQWGDVPRREDLGYKWRRLAAIIRERAEFVILADAHHLRTPGQGKLLLGQIVAIKSLFKNTLTNVDLLMIGNQDIVDAVVLSDTQLARLSRPFHLGQ